MNQKYDLDLFYHMLIDHMNQSRSETDFPEAFINVFTKGDKAYYKSEQVKTKMFDTDWIYMLDTFIPHLERIISNMRSMLRNDAQIVQVEKVKKVTPNSIKHLVQHTQFVDHITDDGDIVPSKVLTEQIEEDYGIYENRFVMTLILKLADFVNKRVEVMEKELYSDRSVQFNSTSELHTKYSESIIKITIEQKDKTTQKDIFDKKKNELDMAFKLQARVRRLQNSRFFKMIKRYDVVKPPILKTQIMIKNPDFKNAYLLWLYIDKHYIFNYMTDVIENRRNFSRDHKEHLKLLNLFAYSTFLFHDKRNKTDVIPIEEDTIRYRKKAKVNQYIPKQFKVDDYAYQFKDETMNEYFLNSFKNMLNQTLKKSEDLHDTKYASMKHAMEQILQITNDMYHSYFEINADEDVFNELVKDSDPMAEYLKAKEKMMIAYQMRLVKYKDLQNVLKLEKKWVNIYEAKFKKLNAQLKKESDQKMKAILEAEKADYAKYKKKLDRDLRNQKERLVSKKRSILNEERTRLNYLLQLEKQKLREKEIAKKQNLKNRYKKLREQAKEKQKKQIEQKISDNQKQVIAKKQALRESHDKKISALREKANHKKS